MKHALLMGLCLLYLNCEQAPNKKEVDLVQKAQWIHLKATPLDTHDDIDVSNFTDTLNYSSDTKTQVNLPKMEAGGLDVAWFVVYTQQGPLNAEGYKKAAENAQAKLDAIHRLVEQYAPDKIGLATDRKEVAALRKQGKKVAMIGVENAYPVGLDTALVKSYYDQGVRYMSLAHNGHNQLSDSNTGEFDGTALHEGISELGKQVIEKMNYYGMMVDVSHPSKASIRQTIAHSKAPVIASHSAARALSDHPRNLDDEQLEWIKTSGGVVQTVALGLFVNKKKEDAYRKVRDSLLKINPEISKDQINAQQAPVDVSDFVDQIDYIKNKIGIDHVGISSDFDGGGGIEGWADASETFNVTLELVKRGYSEADIQKIWSGNLLRVLDRVQAVAQQLQGK